MPLLPTTVTALRRRLTAEQVGGRAPSLVAGIVRDGALVWSDRAGDTGVPTDTPASDVQYRIGSITKTFTAALVMQLRDEGALDLADRVERHLPGTPVGGRTIGALLSHTAGVAAETTPPWWERTDGSARSLADVLGPQPLLHPEAEVYHYSNTGYGVLGELVAARCGTGWWDAVRARLLEPLHMARTSTRPAGPAATGLAVHPWADLVLPEPEHDAGVLAPAGQLWSTLADLTTWARVLAGQEPRVLAPATAEQMRGLAVVSDDAAGWTSGHGLGLQILLDTHGSRAGHAPRRLAGHTGSMPGFVATLWTSAADGLAALALANATGGPAVPRLAADLLDLVAAAEPLQPAPWAPRSDPDPRLLAVTGPWYWGAAPFALRVTAGRDLELTALGARGRESRFTPAGPDDEWTGRDGYYRGERLRVRRDGRGSPTHLDLASFVFTREPYDPAAPVPGGVDPGGWTTRRLEH